MKMIIVNFEQEEEEPVIKDGIWGGRFKEERDAEGNLLYLVDIAKEERKGYKLGPDEGFTGSGWVGKNGKWRDMAEEVRKEGSRLSQLLSELRETRNKRKKIRIQEERAEKTERDRMSKEEVWSSFKGRHEEEDKWMLQHRERTRVLIASIKDSYKVGIEGSTGNKEEEGRRE